MHKRAWTAARLLPNPHTGGNIDWSLVKEILRQAGIKAGDREKA